MCLLDLCNILMVKDLEEPTQLFCGFIFSGDDFVRKFSYHRLTYVYSGSCGALALLLGIVILFKKMHKLLVCFLLFG